MLKAYSIFFLAVGTARGWMMSWIYRLILGAMPRGFRCGYGLRVEADSIHIGANVTIGDNVQIRCRQLVLEDGARIGDNVQINGVGSVTIGAYALIEEDVRIDGFNHAALDIGHHSWIGRRSILNASDDLSIGRRVCVGINSKIFTHGCWWETTEGYRANYQPVIIKDDVWLAVGVIVQPGAVIEERTLINSGAVVAGCLRARGVYAGVPAVRKSEVEINELSIHEKYLVIFKHLNAIAATPQQEFASGETFEFVIGRRRRRIRVVFWDATPARFVEKAINFVPVVENPPTFDKRVAVIDLTQKVSFGDEDLAHPVINALKDHCLRILPNKYLKQI